MLAGLIKKALSSIFFTIGVCAVPAVAKVGESPPRPNIIVIFADDLGYGDLSSFGSTQIETPNIDRLADGGVKLTSWYAASNVCTPSRAGLLTGRYAPRSGMQFVTRPHSDWGMSPDETTIAEMLRSAGYATGMVGKWHLGHRAQYWPTNQGFDSFMGVAYSNDMAPFDLYRGSKIVEKDIDQSRLSGKYADEAVRFIRENKARPFFLYYAESFPHHPAIPARSNIGRSAAGDYGDTVLTVDDAVGRVLDALDEEGIAEKTLVVFTSDNGPWFEGSSGPLRARKGETYDGGFRVPFLARWPARIPAGLVNDHMAQAIDLLPTFARLSGASVPDDRVIDGMDITDMLTRGSASPHDVIYFINDNGLAAVRDDRFKLVLESYYRGSLIPFRNFTGVKLFDLRADPAESYDVANRHSEVVAHLLAKADKMSAIIAPTAAPDEHRRVRPVEGEFLGPKLDGE